MQHQQEIVARGTILKSDDVHQSLKDTFLGCSPPLFWKVIAPIYKNKDTSLWFPFVYSAHQLVCVCPAQFSVCTVQHSPIMFCSSRTKSLWKENIRSRKVRRDLVDPEKYKFLKNLGCGEKFWALLLRMPQKSFSETHRFTKQRRNMLNCGSDLAGNHFWQEIGALLFNRHRLES